MKSELTGEDLVFIHAALTEDLRFANYSEGYKEKCKETLIRIQNSLKKIKVEVSDD